MSQLKLSQKQVQAVLDHPDSVYIRAIGFLFLRHTCPPQELLTWIEPYLDDDAEIELSWKKNKTV